MTVNEIETGLEDGRLDLGISFLPPTRKLLDGEKMNSVESILSTVRQARLLTLLPSLALCQRDQGLKAVSLIEPNPCRTVGLLWMRGAHRRVAARAFAAVTEKVLEHRNLPS